MIDCDLSPNGYMRPESFDSTAPFDELRTAPVEGLSRTSRVGPADTCDLGLDPPEEGLVNVAACMPQDQHCRAH